MYMYFEWVDLRLFCVNFSPNSTILTLSFVDFKLLAAIIYLTSLGSQKDNIQNI